MRWNTEYLNIEDYAWQVYSHIYYGFYMMAFATVPFWALFVLFTPKRIEATMFAFFVSLAEFCTYIMEPGIGNFINS